MTDSDKLLSRLAALETELSTLRSQNRQPAPAFDVAAFKAQLVADPYGTLSRLGVNQSEMQHLQRVHVAHVLGDQAPPELKMLAAQGPQISTTSQLASTVEAISRRLDEQDKRGKQDAARASVKSLIADKAKYPHLSAAYAANPALYEDRINGMQGDADAIAKTLESEAEGYAKVYNFKPAQPASDENAVTTQEDQSGAGKPAIGMNGDVPQIPDQKVKPFDKDEHDKLKAEILGKYKLS